MRKPLALVCTFALCLSLACDDGDGDSDDGGTGSSDRTSAVLGLSGDSSNGAMVYATYCGIATCHGPDGSGSDTAPPLSEEVPELGDMGVVETMLNGVGSQMPPQSFLSDQELADVLAYVDATFG